MHPLTGPDGDAESADAPGDLDPDQVVVGGGHRRDAGHRAALYDEAVCREGAHCARIVTE